MIQGTLWLERHNGHVIPSRSLPSTCSNPPHGSRHIEYRCRAIHPCPPHSFHISLHVLILSTSAFEGYLTALVRLSRLEVID